MKTILGIVLGSLVAGPVLAAPAYPLDELLARAKFVCIAEVSGFDGATVLLKVQSELRGQLHTNNLSFPVETSLGKPEQGKQYFVFSQGHDHWGDPKNQIQMSQGMHGQGSYCGWLMFPIEQEKGVEVVSRAYSFQFRRAEEGIGPLTLDQAKQLVERTTFKGEKNSEPQGGGYSPPAARSSKPTP